MSAQFLKPGRNAGFRISPRRGGVLVEVEGRDGDTVTHLEVAVSQGGVRELVVMLCRDGGLPAPWKD